MTGKLTSDAAIAINKYPTLYLLIFPYLLSMIYEIYILEIAHHWYCMEIIDALRLTMQRHHKIEFLNQRN